MWPSRSPATLPLKAKARWWAGYHRPVADGQVTFPAGGGNTQTIAVTVKSARLRAISRSGVLLSD